MRPLAFLVLLSACNRGDGDAEPFQTLDVARQLADEGQQAWPTPAGGWIEAVWGYGVLRLADVDGDATRVDYAADWMDHLLPAFEAQPSESFRSSDEMSVAIVASTTMVARGSQAWEPIIDAANSYLASAPRTDEGAIEHWGPDAPFGEPGQVWVDSLFMFGVFLLEEHRRTGRREPLEAFIEQYRLFSRLCRSEADQLYRHAYDDVEDVNIPTDPVFWARGNAWIAIAGVEALALVGKESADYAALAPLVRSHLQAVMASQADDGLWHTVMTSHADDPMNYTETSASALFGYALALALKHGVLTEDDLVDTLAPAVEGVLSRIDDKDPEDFVVEGTSLGTVPGDYANYVGVGTLDDFQLGVGAVVMFLAEVDGLPDPSGGAE